MKLAGATPELVAAVVCDALERHGCTAVLTGGACVMIYAEGKYASRDLDFVVAGPGLAAVEEVLAGLGFRPEGRVYVHPDVDLAVDVGNRWPPAVGQQILTPPPPRLVSGCLLRMLSPTDCVKDRLAAFYFWDDRQALAQAVLVALARPVNVREVGRWSRVEGREVGFQEFYRALSRRRRKRRAGRPAG